MERMPLRAQVERGEVMETKYGPNPENMFPLPDYSKAFIKRDEQPTLRDKFAMAALTGIISNPSWDGNLDKSVKIAYIIADAMLAARKQNTNEKGE
jgi:hypothetical protein